MYDEEVGIKGQGGGIEGHEGHGGERQGQERGEK